MVLTVMECYTNVVEIVLKQKSQDLLSLSSSSLGPASTGLLKPQNGMLNNRSQQKICPFLKCLSQYFHQEVELLCAYRFHKAIPKLRIKLKS